MNSDNTETDVSQRRFRHVAGIVGVSKVCGVVLAEGSASNAQRRVDCTSVGGRRLCWLGRTGFAEEQDR
jgi:hypothetical protein